MSRFFTTCIAVLFQFQWFLRIQFTFLRNIILVVALGAN